MDTTFFGPHPRGHDKKDPIFEDPKTLNIRFENNLLFPLPGQPNYLYGCAWRPKSKKANTAAEFFAASEIADTSRVTDPRFTDMLARDFRLLPDSPAIKQGVGVRDLGRIPRRSPCPSSLKMTGQRRTRMSEVMAESDPVVFSACL